MRNKNQILKKMLGFLPALALAIGVFSFSPTITHAQPAEPGNGSGFIPYCLVENGEYSNIFILANLIDFYLDNDEEGDDFVINDNDADPDNDTEDCQEPAQIVPDPLDQPECDNPDGNCDDVPGDQPCDPADNCDDVPGDQPCDPADNCDDVPIDDTPEDTPENTTTNEADEDAECYEKGFTDYGYEAAPEFEKDVAVWARCEDVVHGYADNDVAFTPDENLIFAHWNKMLARASDIADYTHEKGSNVNEYFDLLVEEGVADAEEESMLLEDVTAERASEMVSEVANQEVVVEATDDGFVERHVALELLYNLFAN